jgi:hypothetical protein
MQGNSSRERERGIIRSKHDKGEGRKGGGMPLFPPFRAPFPNPVLHSAGEDDEVRTLVQPSGDESVRRAECRGRGKMRVRPAKRSGVVHRMLVHPLRQWMPGRGHLSTRPEQNSPQSARSTTYIWQASLAAADADAARCFSGLVVVGGTQRVVEVHVPSPCENNPPSGSAPTPFLVELDGRRNSKPRNSHNTPHHTATQHHDINNTRLATKITNSTQACHDPPLAPIPCWAPLPFTGINDYPARRQLAALLRASRAS